MPEHIVREATSADSAAIAGLLNQLGYPAPPNEIPARLDDLRAAGATVLVAQLGDDGDDIVGLATMHVLSVINRPRTLAQLTALVVDDRARRTGVGRSLVAAVEARARSAGCERLSVTTHERRADAHMFYASIGFEHTGRRFGKAL